MKTVVRLTLAAALGAAAQLVAHPAAADDSHHGAGSPQVAQAPTLADGEVRKVDKEAKKITLKHGPITNLDMPAMTMVFQVKDPAMLDQVKAGDKVRFQAEKIGGAFTVTRIETAK
jgi:Cu/Ag efflux protein CusF